MSDDVWRAETCSPAEIEVALRGLLTARTEKTEAFVPARVLNLVVVVDREWRGEIANRLEQVGRYHASRTVMCVVEQGRTQLSAWARMTSPDEEPPPGEMATGFEEVEIDVGPHHLPVLDTIVDPVLIQDLLTVVWSPHGHPEAIDALKGLAHVVLLDSVEELDVHAAVTRVEDLAADLYVVDLAWLRSTPWRERVASLFDTRDMRQELGRISGVTVRHHPESAMAALLFVGWLGSRLGWKAEALIRADGGWDGKVRGRRQDVKVRLESEVQQSVPGLAGITVDTASGLSISLDRAPGGLDARQVDRKGQERNWKVLGASRGEGGILGEGVRQALLRDPTYRPALDAAKVLVG
jgi:glucose-6-phosphate dehydrogenase assembly protein OpcA